MPTPAAPSPQESEAGPPEGSEAASSSAVDHTFSAAITMDDPTLFDAHAYEAALAQELGVPKEVVTTSVTGYLVSITYEFAVNFVEQQLRAALASVTHVGAESIVLSVTGGANPSQPEECCRRLSADGRRLATTVAAEIQVTDAATAKNVKQVLATDALNANLAESGGSDVPVVKTAPSVTVNTETKIHVAAGQTVAAPTSTQLATVGSKVGGAVVVTGGSLAPASASSQAQNPGVASISVPVVPRLGLLLSLWIVRTVVQRS